MQNVKDMKDVEPGIFIPTEQCFLTDEDAWCSANRGYSCMRHRFTNELLFAFKNEIDGPAYREKHYDIPTFCVGGYNEFEPDFGLSHYLDWSTLKY